MFDGIVRGYRVAQGLVHIYKNMCRSNVPIIVRLQGINADIAKELIDNSCLDVQSAQEIQEASDKVKAVIEEKHKNSLYKKASTLCMRLFLVYLEYEQR